MQDLMSVLKRLHRPRLLARAARIGAEQYQRGRHLRRVLQLERAPGSGVAVMALLELEAEMDELRRADNAGYSALRHIDVLIAIIGEARLLRMHGVAEG
ncbi:DUF6477 family protein [Pseudaestuariivita sp.]|uniref:DUF6477 family protein n=1 Tax=Pseudaestuariivita sp. TaxID=2211669 RepID=UPI004059A92F